jgi:hypothetical protein
MPYGWGEGMLGADWENNSQSGRFYSRDTSGFRVLKPDLLYFCKNQTQAMTSAPHHPWKSIPQELGP